MCTLPISAYLADKPDGMHEQTGATSISHTYDNELLMSGTRDVMEIRVIVPLLTVASSQLLHDKVASHNLKLFTGIC